MINSAITQAHIQGFELAFPINDLMKHMKELVLWNHSCRISMTPDSSRLSERSSAEGPVMIMYQKPEDLNQTNNS